MKDLRKAQALARLTVASYTVRELLQQINKIEADTQAGVNEKLSQIKKIREEITKVGTEIDSISREITLLNAHNLN